MTDLPTGTVTFLFTDIEGSTRLVQRLGERYPEVFERHCGILRKSFRDTGGREVGTEGDSFFIVFESAPAAVSGAVAAQRALSSYKWLQGGPVRVRIGLHTGEGTLGGDNYIGIDVNRAARVAAAGHGGQVLLSSATRELVEQALADGLGLRDLGEHRLKDLAKPEHLFQLVIPGLPNDFPAPRSLEARPNNLPLELTSFIGRKREIEEVRRALEESRLVTLTGPGGTGKTRLGLQVGAELLDRFEHGVFFVGLAPVYDPDLLSSTIARALGVSEVGARPIMDTLKEYLRDRELLLILDNFEQIAGAAPTLVELLKAGPRLRLLVTSRAVLHVSGEAEYQVPPLELPDYRQLPPLEVLSQYEAVILFIQRAQAVRPGFTVTNENAPAVAEICARLDGLPLALELAAARVRLLTPQAILARLESRLTLLTGGARDLPARQQSLRDAIGWSYDLLDEPERALFRTLSVFVGGWNLEAAEVVCNPEGRLRVETLDALGSLADKSLIRQTETEGGEPRFRMLEVIREYALERLAQEDEAEEIRRRHAGFFLDLAETVEPKLTGPGQARWLDTVELEHENLRAALDWLSESGNAVMALRLGSSLWRFWQMRGFLHEARQRLTNLLALPGASEDPAVRAKALEALGGVTYWMADYEIARGFYEESLEIHRRLGDRAGIANALYNISFTYEVPQTDLAAAKTFAEESLAIFRELGDEIGIAKSLWALGSSGSEPSLVDDETAEAYLTEAIAIFRRLDDRFSLGWVLHSLGLRAVDTGEFEEARARLSEALAIFADARDMTGILLLLDDFSVLALARGQRERALRLAGAEAALQAATGTDLVGSMTRFGGRDLYAQGVTEEAEISAWAEGQIMSVEEAVAYALKDSEA
jgi:predicted ATPase/class 3 adenylate cyclase